MSTTTSSQERPQQMIPASARGFLHQLKIRHKLVAIIMLTCAVTLAMAGAAFMSFQVMETRRKMVKDLKTTANIVAWNSSMAISFDDPQDAEDVLNALQAEPSVVYACIRKLDGSLFAKYFRSDVQLNTPLLHSLPQDGYQYTHDYLILTQSIYHDKEKMGTVSVWSDLTSLHAMIQSNTLIILAVLLVSLLGAFLLSSRIQGVISTPILALAGVARSVSEERKYSIRAQKRSNDEVGLLIDSFNDMLSQIQQRDAALVTANEELENRVEERTIRLKEANVQLKDEILQREKIEVDLHERTERIIRHQAALLRLGKLTELELDMVLRATTEEVARTLSVERVSVWEIPEEQNVLMCRDQYLLSQEIHEEGENLNLVEYPQYHQVMEASRIVAADDALKDPRTEELSDYLNRHQIYSVMDVPIRLHGRLVGILCLEQIGQRRQWTLEEQDFAASVADMVMLRLETYERRRAQQALRESEHRYRTLLKNIPQKIVYKDLQSHYVLCNESYATDFGLRPEDLQGKTDFELHPRELAQRYIADDQRIMQTGMLEEIEEPYELNGQRLTIQTLKSPVRDEEGHIIGIFAIFWDITARKEAEQALATLNQDLQDTVLELRRSNAELQDFAYVTAHDLKAPLRAIGTLTDWLYTDYGDRIDEQGREQMLLVKGRVARMNELIDSILRYSEIGRGQRNLNRIDCNVLVSESIAMIDPPESIDIVVEGSLPIVTCEKIRLMQVFQNLIGNAIKYMDKPAGRVLVGCQEVEGSWQFYVADNGPGIDEKYHERIFKMFQTLTPRDELESTGIGLAVVKKIVELFGGKVWVESKLGRGTTFFFSLPKSQVRMEREPSVF